MEVGFLPDKQPIPPADSPLEVGLEIIIVKTGCTLCGQSPGCRFRTSEIRLQSQPTIPWRLVLKMYKRAYKQPISPGDSPSEVGLETVIT